MTENSQLRLEDMSLAPDTLRRILLKYEYPLSRPLP